MPAGRSLICGKGVSLEMRKKKCCMGLFSVSLWFFRLPGQRMFICQHSSCLMIKCILQIYVCIRFSEGKEHLAYYNLLKLNNVNVSVISEYYTDGKELYAICALDGKIYHLEKKEDSYTLNLPVGE